MKTALIAMLGETRKALLISWTYRVNALMSCLQLMFIFVGIGFFMGRGQLQPQELTTTLIGYLAWYYTIIAMGDLCWGIRSEMQAGTLEQLAMSGAPTVVVITGRLLAAFLWATPQIALMALLLRALLGVVLPVNLPGVLMLLVTLIGVYGFGLMIGGATLVFRQLESLVNLLQNVFLFMNGSMLPVALLPPAIATVSRLLPSTLGIILMRRVTLEGDAISATWADGSLPLLLAQSVAYLALGALAFVLCERVAKRQGSLGQY